MLDTPAAIPSSAPVFPPGRYGRRRADRRGRRWLPALLALVLCAGLVVASVRLYQLYGDPDHQAEVITYTGITDRQVVIDFRVFVPDGGAAICMLRARSRDGAVVGRAEVRVEASGGEGWVASRHTVETTARPFIGEVIRCRPPG